MDQYCTSCIFSFQRIYLSHSLNVGSCNKASRLGGNEDGTFDTVVCPYFIHHLCHLILHLDGQCVDLVGKKTKQQQLYCITHIWHTSGKKKMCSILLSPLTQSSHLGVRGIKSHHRNIVLHLVVYMRSGYK